MSGQNSSSQRNFYGKEASFFSISGLLEKSKLKHLFKCPEKDCSYSSDDPLDFLLHIKIHPKTAYQCVYCFREYSTREYSTREYSKVNLILHQIRVHGSDIYQCSLCYFRSPTRYFLAKHFKCAHPSKPCIFFLAKKVTLSNKEARTFFRFCNIAKLEKASLPKMESLASKSYNSLVSDAGKRTNEEIMTRDGKGESINCPKYIDNSSVNHHQEVFSNAIPRNQTWSELVSLATHLSNKNSAILNQEAVELVSTLTSQHFGISSSSTPPKFVHLTLQREGVASDFVKSIKVSMQSFSPSCKKVLVSDNNDNTKNKIKTSSPKCKSLAGNHITMQPSLQSRDNAYDDDDNLPLCKLASLIKDVSPSKFSKGVRHSLISDKRNGHSRHDEVNMPKKGLRSKWQTPFPHHDGAQTLKHLNPLSGNECDASEPLGNLEFNRNHNDHSITTRKAANDLYPDNSSFQNEAKTPLPHSEDKLSSPINWSKLRVRLPTKPTCTIPFNSIVSVRNIYPQVILKDIMKEIIC